MHRHLSASGDARPADVWELYAHPDAWPGWAPQIRSVSCPDATIRVGSRGTVVGLFGLTIDFLVTAVDERARSWSWQVRAPLGVRLDLSHRVEPVGGGTRTLLRISGPAPIVLGYTPIAAHALRRLVR